MGSAAFRVRSLTSRLHPAASCARSARAAQLDCTSKDSTAWQPTHLPATPVAAFCHFRLARLRLSFIPRAVSGVVGMQTRFGSFRGQGSLSWRKAAYDDHR